MSCLIDHEAWLVCSWPARGVDRVVAGGLRSRLVRSIRYHYAHGVVGRRRHRQDDDHRTALCAPLTHRTGDSIRGDSDRFLAKLVRSRDVCHVVEQGGRQL